MNKVALFEGIDISSHNGVVDIKRVRDAGIKMVAIRAGYGKNNVDQRFVANAQACFNLDVPAMGYWFSYALNEDMSRNEADYVCDQMEKFWDSCPIASDIEYDTRRYARTKGVEIDRELATKMNIAFLKRVKERGHIPVLYTNNDYTKNYFDIDRIINEVGSIYIWYARYNVDALTDSEENLADIWQYTSKGSVAGVSGNVDLNKFYADLTTLCVKIEEDESATTCNINIQNFQKAANADGYRDQNANKLTEDGIDGAKTQYVRKQILLRIKKEGTRYVTISSGEVVKWVQTRCNEILGTNIDINGEYDAETRSAVLQLQEKLNLAVDELVGYDTIQALFYN